MVEVSRAWRRMIFVLAVVLSGCAGLNNGATPIIGWQDGTVAASHKEAAEIRTVIQSDCLKINSPSADAQTRRNRLVSAYMFAVDLSYYEYERNLLDSIRENNLGAASASLALSSVGAVVGDQELARALATANSIVTGTHTAIDRDYLLNQTLTVLQTQMRANRATQRAVIVRRRSLDYADWDSCMALSDVLAFEQAGTLNGALAAVAADAAEANRQGERQADDAIMRAPYSRDQLSRALRDFVYPADRLLWPDRAQIVDDIITRDGLLPNGTMPVGIRRTLILNFDDPTRAADRRKLADAIVAMTTLPEALRAPIRAALPPPPQ